MSDIITEIDERTDTENMDNGIKKKLEVDETMLSGGERAERETEVNLLEDGGVHIQQEIQGCFDSLTLNGTVVRRLIREYQNRSTPQEDNS